jgi:hypothetical protein
MTGRTEWHVDEQTLRHYADGTAAALVAGSVEQHVLRCPTCRGRVNALVDPPFLTEVWDRVRDDVQAPRPAPAERLLARLGLPADQALLLWSAPAFRAPWLAATLLTLAFATLAASVDDRRGVVLFLVVAPLLPVAGVALAYGPDADPAFEVASATPFSALRLLLLRTVAVLATTVPVTVVAGLLVPGTGGLAVAWLAPSLAAVALTLAGATLTTVARSAAAASALWVVAVAVVAGPGLGSPTVAVAPSRLPVYVAVAVVSLVVVRVRDTHLNQLGDPT